VGLEVKMEVTNMRSRTTYILLFRNGDFLDRTNERREKTIGEGEKHSGSFIAGGHIAIFRNEGRLLLGRESSLSF
jgi:hypothetical protein